MTKPPRERWTVISNYTRNHYACGVRAGERVALIRSFDVRDHRGRVTGPSYAAGGVWLVLCGSEDHPTVVWLQAPDDSIQTWSDDRDFWVTFERTQ